VVNWSTGQLVNRFKSEALIAHRALGCATKTALDALISSSEKIQATSYQLK
jgi:hypothetical protein